MEDDDDGGDEDIREGRPTVRGSCVRRSVGGRPALYRSLARSEFQNAAAAAAAVLHSSATAADLLLVVADSWSGLSPSNPDGARAISCRLPVPASQPSGTGRSRAGSRALLQSAQLVQLLAGYNSGRRRGGGRRYEVGRTNCTTMHATEPFQSAVHSLAHSPPTLRPRARPRSRARLLLFAAARRPPSKPSKNNP